MFGERRQAFERMPMTDDILRELNASIRWMREPMELPSLRRPD